MKISVVVGVGTLLLAAACGGDDSAEFTAAGGTGGNAGASAGGSAGASTGGSAGASTGGSAGSSTGGAGTGGSAGAGTGGAGTGGTGTGGAGTGGAAACPGTAPGCMIDWAGSFTQQGTADGVGTAARFDNVGDLTGDGSSIWVAAHNAVRRVDIATATVTTFAGTPGQAGAVNATGKQARFGAVAGIATDGTTLWVTDTSNLVIRAVDIASAAVTTLAGTFGQGGNNDGTGAAARFAEPRGIAFDGTYLYLVEIGNNAVRRIDPKTGAVITLAGKNGQGNTDGAGTLAKFWSPRGVEAFSGSVWVGDTENHRIRKLVPGTDAASTSVGTAVGAAAGYADATGTAALLRRLRGIGNDGSALIVADSDNFVIRKVELPSLAVTTLAGTAGSATHAVGIGAAARFNKPMDVHFDPGTGDLFIVEGSVIRRMYYK